MWYLRVFNQFSVAGVYNVPMHVVGDHAKEAGVKWRVLNVTQRSLDLFCNH